MEGDDIASILATAVGQSENSIILTTGELELPGPEIVYVNEAATRMTGYTREELLGATPRIHQGPATERAELDRLKANLRAGDPFEGCTWNYRKDGTAYQIEWTVTPLYVSGEEIDYFLSVQRDVTELYQVHQQLEAETRRLESLLNSAGAAHDAVTGALSNQGMVSELQGLIDEAVTSDSMTGLVSLQFRRLNRVAQAYGVEAINQLLFDIGERLAGRLEPSESLARSHEHAFAVLVPVADTATGDANRHLKERARALVAAVTEDGFEVGGDPFQAQVGAGIARATADSGDAYELSFLAYEAACALTTQTPTPFAGRITAPGRPSADNWCSRMLLGVRSARTSWWSFTSRSWIWAAIRSWGRRRWCAGLNPKGRRLSDPTSSSRWPKRWASWTAWAPASSSRPAVNCGTGSTSRITKRSGCR